MRERSNSYLVGRMSQRRTLRRIGYNIVRFPIRSANSIRRRLDPNYELERQAKSFPYRLRAQTFSQLQTIPGRCGERECRLLAHLVTLAPNGGEIVEIGAFKGRVTGWLVEAAQLRANRPVVVSIDSHTWGTRADFEKTVTDLGLSERGLRVHYATRVKSGPAGRNRLHSCGSTVRTIMTTSVKTLPILRRTSLAAV